jgi:hypothetical protein
MIININVLKQNICNKCDKKKHKINSVEKIKVREKRFESLVIEPGKGSFTRGSEPHLCSCRDYVPNLQCPQERSFEDLV